MIDDGAGIIYLQHIQSRAQALRSGHKFMILKVARDRLNARFLGAAKLIPAT